MGLGAAVAGAVGGPLLALGGFGLVAAVSATLIVPLGVVWALAPRPAGARPGDSAGTGAATATEVAPRSTGAPG